MQTRLKIAALAGLGAFGVAFFAFPTTPVGRCRAWSGLQGTLDARIAVARGDHLYKSMWIYAEYAGERIPGVSYPGLIAFKSEEPHPGYHLDEIASLHTNGNKSVDQWCVRYMSAYAKAFNAEMLNADPDYGKKYGAIAGDSMIQKEKPEGPNVIRAAVDTSKWSPGIQWDGGVSIWIMVARNGQVTDCRPAWTSNEDIKGQIAASQECSFVRRNARFVPMRLGDGTPIPWSVIARPSWDHSEGWTYRPVEPG